MWLSETWVQGIQMGTEALQLEHLSSNGQQIKLSLYYCYCQLPSLENDAHQCSLPQVAPMTSACYFVLTTSLMIKLPKFLSTACKRV